MEWESQKYDGNGKSLKTESVYLDLRRLSNSNRSRNLKPKELELSDQIVRSPSENEGREEERKRGGQK